MIKSELHRITTRKIDNILFETAKEKIYKGYGVEDIIKKEYVLNDIRTHRTIFKMRETWIELSYLFSLLNTKLCANKEQSKAFYQQAMDYIGGRSIPQKNIEAIGKELDSVAKSICGLTMVLLEERYFDYIGRTGSKKDAYDIFGYCEIVEMWKKINCFGIDRNVDVELFTRFGFCLEEYQEARQENLIEDVKAIMKGLFLNAVIYTLQEDTRVLYIDLMDSGRFTFLIETGYVPNIWCDTEPDKNAEAIYHLKRAKDRVEEDLKAAYNKYAQKKNKQENEVEKGTYSLPELMESMETLEGKALIQTLIDLKSEIEESSILVYNSCATATRVSRGNELIHHGLPYEKLYLAFNLKNAKNFLDRDLEVTEDFNFDSCHINGLRSTTYAKVHKIDNETLIVIGWDSLVFAMDKVDPKWEEEKARILAYIEDRCEKYEASKKKK